MMRASLLAAAVAVACLVPIGVTGHADAAGHQPKCNPHARKLVMGTNGPDRLVSSKCHEVFEALLGDDVVIAGDGDVARGGGGNDRLSDLEKTGRLNGGNGRDVCIVSAAGRVDTVNCERVVVR